MVAYTVKDLTWERPLGIIKYPDPRLRAVNAKIGVFGDKVKQLGMEMLEVMYNGYAVLFLLCVHQFPTQLHATTSCTVAFDNCVLLLCLCSIKDTISE